MGTSWYSFSSKQRKERKALKALKALYDCTSPTHSSDRRPITEVTQERPPPYTARAIQIPTIEISSAEPDESQYAFLRDFDTVFLVDDSSSMQGPRWREAADAIAAIAPICTQYDSDGIDIYFLNHRRSSPRDRQSTWRQPSYQPGVDGYQQITTARQVQEIFNSVRPSGSTMVGTRLSDILDPYLRRVEAMHAARKARGYVDPDVLVKPMNIITITDGEFTDDAEGVIIKTARKLDGPTCDAIPWQVGIQFFQIGNDARARDFLQQLDDDLRTGVQMRDIVDTIPWMRDGVPLNSDGILKTVLGAVNKRLDRQRL